jgi:hypothetical protein
MQNEVAFDIEAGETPAVPVKSLSGGANSQFLLAVIPGQSSVREGDAGKSALL